MNLIASLGTGAAEPRIQPERAPQIATARPTATKHALAGYGHVRTVMEFMKWAHEQDRFPTIEAVSTRFNVCRATAYRWTSALAETYGIDPPVRSGAEAK